MACGGAPLPRSPLSHRSEAVELRHEPSLAYRDGDELVCACGRCSALGYADSAEDVVGGALFEDECPDEEPPALTALVMTHVLRSRWPSTGDRFDVT